MAQIAHRISIAAAPARVHELLTSSDGIGRWWTGRPVDGDTAVGARFGLYFGAADQPAAVMRVTTDTPRRVAWRCEEGPADWRNTEIAFELKDAPDGGTTLLFAHTGWAEVNEFLAGCTTNWGAYLTSLKDGAEGSDFGAYPAGEISRW